MAYQALYRKFRPTKFEDVKGQDAIVETLKNQIEGDRVGHAYLFCGTRGTGKTTIAKIFARSVNCEHPVDGSPCGECPSCQAIQSGASLNVQEIDAASNTGVDNIRDIIEDTAFTPAQGRYKVYIIDEVHMLSAGAFNALLKTLEEPPAYVIFILATTEVHKIPLTILSRCQRYDFKRISVDTITARLQELMDAEQIEAEEKALRYIARSADGAMRDALSLLDQCIAFKFGEKLTYDLVLDVLGAVDTEIFSKLLRSILDQNPLSCISLLDEIVMQGRELVQFMTDFNWYLRNLLLVKVAEHAEDVVDMSSENLARIREEAERADEQIIMRYIRVISELTGKLRQTSQKRVMIEITLIKLCRPQMEVSQDAILDRLRAVEEKLEQGAGVGNISPELLARAAAAAGGGEDAPAQKVKTVPLPAAIPAEVQEVANQWSTIIMSIENPLKTYLKNAIPTTQGEANKLLVAFTNENTYHCVKDNQQIDQKVLIEEAIAQVIHKSVEVEFKLQTPDQTFTAVPASGFDEIQMDIEIDDDEDQ
ncbi:MAG: DNA polymerase III subunit gamma/tau [Lachnospiraceae bacterium]|nr:DNA polymerase III subunit gamma/tau [Lachnospiraceae bacterium]